MALSWEKLAAMVGKRSMDIINGPTNSYSRLRLFGQKESSVRVTLFRDHHAWCPYCQKVWLWLENKRVPYKIEKVTMFCYGKKEPWFKKIVPSGMLPAVKVDNRVITESDTILEELEEQFGPLFISMSDPKAMRLRRLERQLFRAWCSWLCYPQRNAVEEQRSKDVFEEHAMAVEGALAATPGPFFLEEFSVVDCIFTPYVERMNASLYYYKGYDFRGLTLGESNPHPRLAAWFAAMEQLDTYRGTQSDFHTHCHDLPPQMGGCYENFEPQQKVNKKKVDQGPFVDVPDVCPSLQPDDAKEEAVARFAKHHANVIKTNPNPDKKAVDEAIRAACTLLLTGEAVSPPKGTDASLRYIRDRINVPRDMPIFSAKLMRQALEDTAVLVGERQGPPLTLDHRRDQNPAPFRE